MTQPKRIREYLKVQKNTNEDCTIQDAIAMLKDYKQKASVKFNESVDAHVMLGIDPTKGDQVVKSTVVLPHGTGRTVRVVVFAEGDDVQKAMEAGAVDAGGDDLIDRVKNGFFDFDKCIATPSIMRKLAPLGKVLGPRGIMPNPKLGTVTTDIVEAVKSFIGGKIEYRTGKDPVIRVSVGRISFDDSQIIENIKELISSIKQAKPSTAKGSYIVKLNVSTTMSGFSVKVPASFL
ncbi:MAG: large subunit ribosomal protein L1 [Candidatus Deianiraeaceae bacterium]|jgi:large subunit ribosomal protein L1